MPFVIFTLSLEACVAQIRRMAMQGITILNLSDVHTWAWAINHRGAGQAAMERLDRMLIRHVFTTGALLIPIETPCVDRERDDTTSGGGAVFRFVPTESLQRECELVLAWLSDLPDRNPELASSLRRMTFEQALEVARAELPHRELRAVSGSRSPNVGPEQRDGICLTRS
jgi:hypothetical protein